MKLSSMVAIAALLLVTGCSAALVAPTVQPTVEPTLQPTAELSQPWSEEWLLGTWEATFPSGIKWQLVVDSVKLVNDTKVQGNTARTYAYTGSLVGLGGNIKLPFKAENWKDTTIGTARGLTWISRAQPGGQFQSIVAIWSTRDFWAHFSTDVQPAQAGTAPDSFMVSGEVMNASNGDTSMVFSTANGLLKFTKLK